MNAQQTEDWVVVGCFGRPHGIKGFVTVHSYTEPQDNILSYNNWHGFIDKRWQPLKLLSAQIHSKAIIAQVEGFPERETVARLTHVKIAINKEQLAPLAVGEYYWHQLIGMSVVNQTGFTFGKVIEVMATGANDVLVIKGEKKYLIPYLPNQFILDINEQSQTITVDWDADF